MIGIETEGEESIILHNQQLLACRWTPFLSGQMHSQGCLLTVYMYSRVQFIKTFTSVIYKCT